jgi:hypothetical protein
MPRQTAGTTASFDVHGMTQDEPQRLRRALLQGLGSMPMLALLGACGGGQGSGGSEGAGTDAASSAGAVSGSGAAAQQATSVATSSRTFKHPGLLHTEADFARMRDKIAKGEQPWVSAWDALQKSGRAQLGRDPTPLETVIRGGTGENHRAMVEDVQRAYQFALRWKVSGDEAYARAAVTYLNAWSSTMKTLTGNNDQILAAGLYGYQWANAGEIMRTYPGFSAADLARLQKMLVDLFYPRVSGFLVNHAGSKITNHWANWDLQAICGILSFGIFCDRADLYDEAVNYYKTGRGNGSLPHMVHYVHPGQLGQWQESPRDPGHTTLGIGLAGLLCEMAWNQGDDLYGLWNNRFLAGAEYVAKANLTDPATGQPHVLPFTPYTTNKGTFTAVASGINFRPCWEVVYNHYVNRKGLDAPYVTAKAASQRPEKLEWVGDMPGFGTLPYSRDPFAALIAPSGVTAGAVNGQVVLSWWGSARARRYNVKRASSASGPFSTIASVTDPRTHVDTPAKGVWFYAVSAVGDSGESAPSPAVRVSTAPELVAHLPLDAGSGTFAADVAGRARHGVLAAGAAWGAGRKGGSAVQLNLKGAHVALPADVLAQVSDYTVAVWVNWSVAATNTRIFDFGTSDIAYMALIPRDSGGKLRFTASRSHYFGEQSIPGTEALPTGRWVHLAVTLAGSTGRLYVDGVQVGENPSIVVTPFQLGDTPNAWLGRSQYGADPSFNGRLQDLRFYGGALGHEEIKALASA